MTRPKKFKENSKIVTIRVPESKADEIRKKLQKQIYQTYGIKNNKGDEENGNKKKEI